jgi:hypothetical protein
MHWHYTFWRLQVRDHRTIQIIQLTKCNNSTGLLLDVYVWLNMFRAFSRPSSGAYNCTRSLWFYRWREAAGALLVVAWQVLTFYNNLPLHIKETFNNPRKFKTGLKQFLHTYYFYSIDEYLQYRSIES